MKFSAYALRLVALVAVLAPFLNGQQSAFAKAAAAQAVSNLTCPLLARISSLRARATATPICNIV
jgi:hypothetical protein